MIGPTSGHGLRCPSECLSVVTTFPRTQHRRHGALGQLHCLVCCSFLPDCPFQTLSAITFDRRVQALTKFAHVYPNALILLEPTLMFPFMSPTDPRSIHGAANVRGALAKRDTWPSRTELRRWLVTSSKSIWARWDPRVLDLYVVRVNVWMGGIVSLDEFHSLGTWVRRGGDVGGARIVYHPEGTQG